MDLGLGEGSTSADPEAAPHLCAPCTGATCFRENTQNRLPLHFLSCLAGKDGPVFARDNSEMYLTFQAKIGPWLFHSPCPRDLASLGNEMKGDFAKQLNDPFSLGPIFFIVLCLYWLFFKLYNTQKISVFSFLNYHHINGHPKMQASLHGTS